MWPTVSPQLFPQDLPNLHPSSCPHQISRYFLSCIMIFKKSSLSIKHCDYHSTGPVTAQSTSSPELGYLPAGNTACPSPKWRTWRSISGSPLRLAKLFVAKKDDIPIFSKSFQEHHIHVCSVLQRFVENRLYNTEKCLSCHFPRLHLGVGG